LFQPRIAGTIGQNRPLEQIFISLNGAGTSLPPNARIEYDLHIGGKGWENNFSNGIVAGDIGRHIEAVRIRLRNLPGYSVVYRVNMRFDGWGDWVLNGMPAGTTGQNRPIDAIQIFITTVREPVRQARIFTDWSGINNKAVASFRNATDEFMYEFGIVFNLTHAVQSTDPGMSGACRNGTSVYNSCIPGLGGCGVFCNSSHCKSGERKLRSLPWSTTVHTIRAVHYKICADGVHDTNNTPIPLLGMATYPPTYSFRESIVSTLFSENIFNKQGAPPRDGIAIVMQHELSHNFGARHCNNTTPNVRCIMKSAVTIAGLDLISFDTWCNPCRTTIQNNIRN
jgi:hypothetical protein